MSNLPMGKWELYKPNKLFDPDTKLLHPLDPLKKLPFEIPSYCPPKVDFKKPLTCHPLRQDKNSTSKSVTYVSKSAKEDADNLTDVKYTPDMLRNLQQYAQMDLSSTEKSKVLTTQSQAKDYPLPPAEDQAAALADLAAWHTAFLIQDKAEYRVRSEEHVRAHVYNQIVILVNKLLKTQYKSDVDARWTYTSEKTKKAMAGVTTENIRGGDSDFVLTSGALSEVKPFYSTGRDTLVEVFMDVFFTDEDGNIKSETAWTRPSGILVSQIWAQLQRHRSKWGFFINGEAAMFFCQTGPTQLSFSKVMNWTSTKLHQTVLGMSFLVTEFRKKPEATAAATFKKICGNLVPLQKNMTKSRLPKLYESVLRATRDEFDVAQGKMKKAEADERASLRALAIAEEEEDPNWEEGDD